MNWAQIGQIFPHRVSSLSVSPAPLRVRHRTVRLKLFGLNKSPKNCEGRNHDTADQHKSISFITTNRSGWSIFIVRHRIPDLTNFRA